MLFQALSVLAPAGSRIRSKRKTLDIHRWSPDSLPLTDLVLVQHENTLSDEAPEDPTGRVVAIVDVLAVREWQPEDLEQSNATEYTSGWLAWELGNVRPLAYTKFISAQKGIFSIDLDPKDTLYPEGFAFPGETVDDTSADDAKE